MATRTVEECQTCSEQAEQTETEQASTSAEVRN